MILALRIQDCRGYREALWEPGPGLHLVIAPNDAGKTTVRVAVEYLLAGRAGGVTDEAGRGADALIRTGAESAVLEALLVDANGEQVGVRRTIPRRGAVRVAVQGIAGSGAMLQEYLAQRFGAPEVVSIALQSSRYLGMPLAAQQAVLTRLAGAAWTLEQITAALGCDALAVSGLPAGLTAGAGMLDEIEKRARAARAEARKDRDQAAGAARSGPEGRILSAADLAAAVARAEELSASRDALLQEIGRRTMLASAARHQEGERARLQGDVDRLGAQVANLETREGVPAARAALSAAMDASAEADRELAAARSTESACAQDERFLADALSRAEAAGAADGHCPLCPDIQCGVQAAGAVDTLARLASGAANRTLLACETAALSAAEAERVANALEDARRRFASADGAAAALERAREMLAERQRELADVAARSNAPVESADEVRQEAAACLAEITSIREQVAAHEAAAGAAQRAAQASVREREASERWEALDALCATFTDGSLRARLLRDVRERFHRLACDALAGMADREACRPEFQIGEDGALGVSSDAWGGVLPVPALSRSMQLRAGVAVSHALCQLAGFRLLLIDDADALDARNRNLLLECLLGLREHYGQIIVLAAQPTPDLPADPGVEGLAFWTITSGQIVRLPAREEAHR